MHPSSGESQHLFGGSRMDSIDEDAFLPDSPEKSSIAASVMVHQRHQHQQHQQYQQYQPLLHQYQHQQQHQQQRQQSTSFAFAPAAAMSTNAGSGGRGVAGGHQTFFGVVADGSRCSSQSSSPATPKEALRSPLVVGIPSTTMPMTAAAAAAPDARRRSSFGQQQQPALPPPPPPWSQQICCQQSSPIMRPFAAASSAVVGASPLPQPQPLQQTPPLLASPTLFRLDPKKHFGNLGRCGLRVSCLGLGTWVTFAGQVPDSVAEDLLSLAYACGINYFDTAEVYSAGKAELLLGRLLRKLAWRRSSYVLSTKVFWGGKAETERGLSRKHVVEGLRGSLLRLQLDYVDIVFANKPDPHTPMEEIVRAFNYCIEQGWAFYWGTSRWSPMEIMEAHSVARQFQLMPPVAEQVEHHMFQRERLELHMAELSAKIGLGAVTWSPLACGILSGKYDDGVPVYSRASLKGYSWLREKILSDEGRQQQEKLKQLAQVAARLDCTLAQLAIAWCVRSERSHCVLLGASSTDQLYENIRALAVVPRLTGALLVEIDRLLGNKPVPPSRTNHQPSGAGQSAGGR